jgi:hypothetical protein
MWELKDLDVERERERERERGRLERRKSVLYGPIPLIKLPTKRVNYVTPIST